MFGGDRPAATAMTEPDAARWYGTFAADPNPYRWVIEFDGRFAGTARLHSLDEHNRCARYAIGILDGALLGRGLGTKTTRVVLSFAFEELALHRVDLRVITYNERAIRCYRRCGFVEEGRTRDSAFVDGTYHDDILMAILATQWVR
jgi:RimJ/RimL family protein N-acetyltransferase